MSQRPAVTPDRTQTGVRMDRCLVKVLKALAAYYDLALGDLLEDIVRSTFAGRKPFSAAALARASEFMRLYGLDPEATFAGLPEERT